MAKSYADADFGPFAILPKATTRAPTAKYSEAEVQTGSELIPAMVDQETSSASRAEIAIQSKIEIYKPPAVDEAVLLAFLKRVEPIALRELRPTSAYQYLEKKVKSSTFEIAASYETDSSYSVTGLSVNCTGSTIAVALRWRTHVGFCRHASVLHFLSTVSASARHQIPLDSCATSVKYHPNYPAIVAIGHHTGEVSIIRNEEKWAHTTLGETHLHEVVAVDWLSERQKVLALVSASSEGLVCIWSLKGRNSRTKVLDQVQQVQVSEVGSISCMTVVPDTNDALIGLESGRIVRVSLPFESALVRERAFFNGHCGPVSAISICSIAPGLFVSVGTDETLCVRNAVCTDPLSVDQFNTVLSDVCWSKKTPAAVAAVSGDRVLVLDFCASTSEPVQILEVPNASRVVWNDIDGTIAVGGTDGRVTIYSCGDGTFETKPGANALLSQWEAQTNIMLTRV
jgi:WD40 repeat protein